MLRYFYSAFVGILVGVIYYCMFLANFSLSPNSGSKPDFGQMLTFMFRFIFIIVASVVLVFYFRADLFWLLLGFGFTFWGCVLTNFRIKK